MNWYCCHPENETKINAKKFNKKNSEKIYTQSTDQLTNRLATPLPNDLMSLINYCVLTMLYSARTTEARAGLIASLERRTSGLAAPNSIGSLAGKSASLTAEGLVLEDSS